MRKVVFMMVALISAVIGTSAVAQTTVEGSKFFDNWSVGLKGGAVTPLHNADFWNDMRGVVGIELHKNITPVVGFGVEGQWSVNTSSWARAVHSPTAFDHQLVGAYVTGNLMNLFGGYKGTPRVFEVVANVGLGWLHGYNHNAPVYNSWYTKFGPDLNFNLGKSKSWTLSLKPAIIYDMTGNGRTSFNINRGYLEVQAGVTYHFKNSNGTHHFKVVDNSELYNELAYLNDEVERLRNRTAEVQIVEKVVVNEVVTEVVKENTVISNAVGFNLNSFEILPTSYASLENVAAYLNENPNVNVNVVGYASAAEGSQEYNLELSAKRSQSVKDALVNKFNINPARLNVVAKGADVQPFKENNWNRTVVFEVQQ